MEPSKCGRVASGARESEEIGEGSNKPDSTKKDTKMKKLMILAATAAIVGATEAACGPGGGATYCGRAYSVKISLKTPTGEICQTSGSASNCGPGTDSSGYVRKPSTYALQGWIAICDCDCADWQTPLIKNTMVALWNTKEKLGMDVTTFSTKYVHVLSKSQRDAELEFTLKGDMKDGSTGAWVADGLTRTFDLKGAGFGKFDVKSATYTSFSGNVIGTQGKVMYPKAVYNETKKVWECPEASYWLCANVSKKCAGLQTNPEASIAYGTFAIRYNAAASKKLASDPKVLPTIPAYVVKPTAW